MITWTKLSTACWRAFVAICLLGIAIDQTAWSSELSKSLFTVVMVILFFGSLLYGFDSNKKGG